VVLAVLVGFWCAAAANRLQVGDRTFAKRLRGNHGADPFEAVLVEHPPLPERVRERRYQQMLELLDERRHKDARNRARAAARARACAGPGN
jgi:hypothetical protein